MNPHDSYTSFVKGAIICISLLGIAHAAPVYETMPAGVMNWYDMTFVGGNPAGGDLRVMVQVAGDRPTVMAFGSSAVKYRHYDGVTIKFSGSRLSGTQRVFEGESSDYFLEMDVSISGGSLSGTYTLIRSKAIKADGTRITSLKDIQGKVSGRIRSESALRSVNSMPDQHSWDSYVGPNQNFSSGRTGVTLIEKPHDAKLVWTSEFFGGMQIGDCRHGWRLYNPTVGGAATPLLYKGKIYQFFHQPTGSAIQKCFVNSDTGSTKTKVENYASLMNLSLDLVKRRFAYRADEYLACIDAATGRTLWRTKWPGEGLNFVGHKNAFTNHTGCAGDGRVYVFGTTGIVRALDAETGKELWTKGIPGYHKTMTAFAEKWIAGTASEPVTRSYAHGLNFVDGVVVAPTGIGGCSMTGIDASSGDSLWVAGGLGSMCTPLRWTSTGGKAYVIGVNGTSTSSGSIFCIEPKTGKVLWTQSGAGFNDHQFTIEGDYLLCDGGCYRLSATGAEKLWSPGCTHGSKPIGIIYEGIAWLRCDTKTEARDVKTGKVLVTDVSFAHTAEQMTFATEGYLYMNKEAQHYASHNFQLFKNDPANWTQLGSTWRPPHPIDLTYAIPVMYPTANGRLFMRGEDGIYCYDIRKGTPAVGVYQEPDQRRSAAVLTPGNSRVHDRFTFDIRGRKVSGAKQERSAPGLYIIRHTKGNASIGLKSGSLAYR